MHMSKRKDAQRMSGRRSAARGTQQVRAAQARGTSDKVKQRGRSEAGRTERATEDDENKGE